MLASCAIPRGSRDDSTVRVLCVNSFAEGSRWGVHISRALVLSARRHSASVLGAGARQSPIGPWSTRPSGSRWLGSKRGARSPLIRLGLSEGGLAMLRSGGGFEQVTIAGGGGG